MEKDERAIKLALLTCLCSALPSAQRALKSPEFFEAHVRSFRGWYDQNLDILLTARARENILGAGPREIIPELTKWVSQKAYPKAKALVDIEPKE